ncbi:MAG: SDR family oxidoreductase [Chitinophagaceae bacterium]
MIKVLVTGANGLVGQHLVKQLQDNSFTVVATSRGPSRLPFTEGDNYKYVEADITNGQAINDLFYREKPAIVVHAGAMTQADDCEKQQDACFEANVQSTAQLLIAAEKYAEFFIFVSTDFVFNGEKGNYAEGDHLTPLSWYGFTKVQAESTVETSDIPWAIVRTCLVYGNTLSGTRRNIISWVKNSLQAGKEIWVVNDQFRTPTYVEDLARGIILIIQQKATGIFHISGKDLLTPYNMAIATANYFNLNKELIKKVDASTFTQPARRPLKTGLDISKARVKLGFEPISFEDAMRLMVNG